MVPGGTMGAPGPGTATSFARVCGRNGQDDDREADRDHARGVAALGNAGSIRRNTARKGDASAPEVDRLPALESRVLEQDAVVSTWPNSDFGPAGTNLSGLAVGVEYQLLDPLTVSARQYVTNYIHPAPGTQNPTQFRLQLDALVKF